MTDSCGEDPDSRWFHSTPSTANWPRPPTKNATFSDIGESKSARNGVLALMSCKINHKWRLNCSCIILYQNYWWRLFYAILNVSIINFPHSLSSGQMSSRQYGTMITDEYVKLMSFEEKSKWLSHCSQTFPSLPEQHYSSPWWASWLCHQNRVPNKGVPSRLHHPLD